MKYYVVEEETSSPFTGDINGSHTWRLPGRELCPTCSAGGGIGGLNYPCVELSSLPAPELKKLSSPGPIPRPGFERLRELVRPLAPAWARLESGVGFGPLTGKGSGLFGDLFAYLGSDLLVRVEALAELREAGLRGLEQACPLQVRFRGNNPPEFHEVQLEFRGQPHPDCVSPKSKPPCPTCGYADIRYLPTLILDAASMPSDLDVFRLHKHLDIMANERFVEAMDRLALDGVKFKEVEAR
ncbi:SitI6 family double-CXXCG motif immunity protein [Pyxidicoccus xibeiensis]|uniref:SitI6 family double-CXXCG motif immunity protein n=1 Tax=Pyxidicoccus xibeiensis TaxID=2906759 RepID=UPI0020A73D4A|nr:double-CXXCG motif protein [Pyxidicoccus xibeiensis]MCP3141740.1 double-CXXCG motif protein [Pyxidicoccus xibeiensis]